MLSTLERTALDPAFFGQVGETVCRLAVAQSDVEVSHLLAVAARQFGADAAVFCSFLRDHDGGRGPTQLRFLVSAGAAAWYLAYQEAVAPVQDPWLVYASMSSEPACASELPITSHAQLEALALARKHGFESMLVVPAPASGMASRYGVLVLGSRRADYFRRGDGYTAIKAMARTVALQLLEWSLVRARCDLIYRGRINDADLELLRLKSRGLRTKEIARELRLSEGAINSRFKRLNKRLGVGSRDAAASLASEYGLL